MWTINIVLYVGAGLHLIDSSYITPAWEKLISPVRDPGLTAADRQEISILEVILLHVRIRDLRIKSWFGIVENLSVSVLLERNFLDRFIKDIFPSERKVVPYHSKMVSILK